MSEYAVNNVIEIAEQDLPSANRLECIDGHIYSKGNMLSVARMEPQKFKVAFLCGGTDRERFLVGLCFRS